MKVCKICNQNLSLDKFNKGHKTCKECRSLLMKTKRRFKKVLEELEIKLGLKIVHESTTKLCSVCDIQKPFSEFAKSGFTSAGTQMYRPKCKSCMKPENKVKYAKIKNDPVKYKKFQEDYKKYRMTEMGKYSQKKSSAKWYKNNKKEVQKKHTEYRKNNPEKEKLRHSRHYQENKEKIHQKRKEFYMKNPGKKYMLTLRNRTRIVYKNRSGKSYELMDCSSEFLEEWFLFHFILDEEKGMTLKNHGDIWQIDHVIPCNQFDPLNPIHMKKCFHWSNLRPLLIHENLSKSGKVSRKYITEQNERLEIFCEEQNITKIKISLIK